MTIQQYYNFLDRHDIRDVEELLLEVSLEPYSLVSIVDERYPNLLMLDVSNQSDLNKEINHIKYYYLQRRI